MLPEASVDTNVIIIRVAADCLGLSASCRVFASPRRQYDKFASVCDLDDNVNGMGVGNAFPGQDSRDYRDMSCPDLSRSPKTTNQEHFIFYLVTTGQQLRMFRKRY